MTKKKGIIYSFCVIFLLLMTLLLSVGISNARISTAFSQKVIYSSKKAEIESNYLCLGGQTVVLDDWTVGSTDTRTETITLSSPVSVRGTVTCVSNSSLVTAVLDKSQLTVNSGGVSATLTLKQSADAASHNKRSSVIVRVTWIPEGGQDEYWANIIFDLCPQNDGSNPVYDETVGLKSNYLADGGQTVYLGSLTLDSSYITKDVELITHTGSISGELSCSSDSEFISVLFDETTQHQHIDVGSNVKSISVLKISDSGTETPLTEKTTVTVRVSWTPNSVIKPTKWADFVFDLIPPEAENAVEDAVQDSVKPTVEFGAISDTFDISKPLRIDFVCSQDADSLEISYNGGEFPEWTKFSTDGEDYALLGAPMKIDLPMNGGLPDYLYLDFSQIPTLDTSNLTPVDLSLTAYSAGAASEAAAKNLTPYFNAPVDTPIFDDNACISNISADEIFFLDFTAPSGSQTIELSYNGGDFPKGTRYSLNNKKFTLKQTAEKITLSVNENKKLRLYLDLSRVEPALITQTVTVGAVAYAGIEELKNQEISFETGLEALDVKYDPGKMIINGASRLLLDTAGGTERLTITVEGLIKTETGTKYVTDPDNFGITVWIDGGKLIIANDYAKAKAGSYKLTLVRSYGELEQKRIEIPFFIHY